jgi:hypothetical protein
MFVTVLAPEVIAAVAPLSAIGATMGAGYATLGAVHAGTASTPANMDPMGLAAHAALHAHHAAAQGMGAEGMAVHAMTVATMGASGFAYAAEDVANMATLGL